MNDDELWIRDKKEYGWELPKPAHKCFRLPVIRHIRAIWHLYKIERHYSAWECIGAARTGYDEWVLYAIQRGWV